MDELKPGDHILLTTKMFSDLIVEIGISRALASSAFDYIRDSLEPAQREVFLSNFVDQVPKSIDQTLNSVLGVELSHLAWVVEMQMILEQKLSSLIYKNSEPRSPDKPEE